MTPQEITAIAAEISELAGITQRRAEVLLQQRDKEDAAYRKGRSDAELIAAEVAKTALRIAHLREHLSNIAGLSKFDLDQSIYLEATAALADDGNAPVVHCITCGAVLACGLCVHGMISD